MNIMNTFPLCETGKPHIVDCVHSPTNDAWSWSNPGEAGQVICTTPLQQAASCCVQHGWCSHPHIPCADSWKGAPGLQKGGWGCPSSALRAVG